MFYRYLLSCCVFVWRSFFIYLFILDISPPWVSISIYNFILKQVKQDAECVVSGLQTPYDRRNTNHGVQYVQWRKRSWSVKYHADALCIYNFKIYTRIFLVHIFLILQDLLKQNGSDNQINDHNPKPDLPLFCLSYLSFHASLLLTNCSTVSPCWLCEFMYWGLQLVKSFGLERWSKGRVCCLSPSLPTDTLCNIAEFQCTTANCFLKSGVLVLFKKTFIRIS